MAAVEAVDDGFHDCEECEEDEFFDAPEGSLASVTPELSGSEASGECSVDHMHLQRNHVSDTREIDIDVACGTESAGLALPGVTRDSEPAEAPRRSSDDWHQTANSEQHREGVEGRANGRDQYIGVEPGCACNGGDEEEGDGEEAGEEELGTSGRNSGIESETAAGKDWQQAKGMESVDAEGEVVFPDEEGEVVLSDEEGEVWGRKDDEEEAAAAAAAEEEEEEEEEGPQLTEEERKEMVEAAEALKKEGNQLFAAGEFEAAMEKYGEALAAAPVDAKETAVYLANRAACSIKRSRWMDAARDCTSSLQVDDSYMKARLRRMLAYDRMDDPERALQDAKKVLEQEPMNRDALQTAARLGPIVQERQEKMKAEMMGKLKDLGNTVLGKFGLSLDNFKVNQDPKTGGYSINFQQ